MKPPLNLPSFAQAVEMEQTSRDQKYFRDHPAAKEYEREWLIGEFWPIDDPRVEATDLTRQLRVRVTQIAPGLRARAALFNLGLIVATLRRKEKA